MFEKPLSLKLFYVQDNEDVQSDMDLDLLAESESDSETENEAIDAAGNVSNVGGGNDGNENRNSEAAGGSAANNDTFFSDDDSGDSSHGDEDESEAGETDEQDGDELTFEAGLSASKFLSFDLVLKCKFTKILWRILAYYNYHLIVFDFISILSLNICSN